MGSIGLGNNAATFPGVSVLVATRNRTRALSRTLESVLACEYPTFEILVIDQSDREQHERRASGRGPDRRSPWSLPSDPRVHVVRSESMGKSRALNVALGMASHPILAFTDDDCTVPPDWLRRGVAQLQAAPDIGLAFGTLRAAPHDPEREVVPTFEPASPQVVRGVSHAYVRCGAGANMFAPRTLFDTIGGFDELLGPGAPLLSSEEYDLYYRTLKGGYGVAVDPDNVVIHYGARPYSDGSGQRLLCGYVFGEGAVIAKHVRSGDRMAMRLGLRRFYPEVKWALLDAAKGRTWCIRRASNMAHGFARGFLAQGAASRDGRRMRPPLTRDNKLPYAK